MQVSASNPEMLSEVLVNVTSSTEEIQSVDISAATTLIEELTEEATGAGNDQVSIAYSKYFKWNQKNMYCLTF